MLSTFRFNPSLKIRFRHLKWFIASSTPLRQNFGIKFCIRSIWVTHEIHFIRTHEQNLAMQISYIGMRKMNERAIYLALWNVYVMY